MKMIVSSGGLQVLEEPADTPSRKIINLQILVLSEDAENKLDE
jgi:hypothetical protein